MEKFFIETHINLFVYNFNKINYLILIKYILYYLNINMHKQKRAIVSTKLINRRQHHTSCSQKNIVWFQFLMFL